MTPEQWEERLRIVRERLAVLDQQHPPILDTDPDLNVDADWPDERDPGLFRRHIRGLFGLGDQRE